MLIDFDRETVKLTEMEIEKSQVEGQGDVDLRGSLSAERPPLSHEGAPPLRGSPT
jgi:hypothetical protein